MREVAKTIVFVLVILVWEAGEGEAVITKCTMKKFFLYFFFVQY